MHPSQPSPRPTHEQANDQAHPLLTLTLILYSFSPEGMELQGQLATDLGIEGLEHLLPQAVVRRNIAEQGGAEVGLAVLWREVHSGRCTIGHSKQLASTAKGER